MLKRNREILLWLDNDELAYVKAQAKKSGLSIQSFLRALIKNQPIKEQPPLDYFAVLKSLDRIGNNINQIAAKANTKGFIDTLEYRKNYDDLKKVVAELLRAVHS